MDRRGRGGSGDAPTYAIEREFEDVASFKSSIDVVHAALSNSRVVVMAGQQHTAMNTAPDLFLREVIGFLTEPER